LAPERRLRYYAIPNPIPGVRRQAWCEECHAVLEEEQGWTPRTLAFADPTLVCTGCYKDVVRPHKRLRLGEGDEEFALGAFENEPAAAIAYDLAARVLRWDPSEYNFADEMIRDLLPIFGDDVLEGLDKKLSKSLRKAMVREMRRLAG